LVHFRTDRLDKDALLPVLEGAMEGAMREGVARTAWYCLEAAPVPAYVGLMTARGGDDLRWTLPLPLDDAVPFLEAVGWEGEVERVRPVLDAAREWTTHTGLSLDVGDGVGPYLGLEFMNWGCPLPGAAVWKACLGTLTAWGACRADKAAALLAYPGISHERGEGWPEGLATGAEHRDNSIRALTRTLLHVKIVLPPGEPLHAKAYLAAKHRWIDRPGPLRAPPNVGGMESPRE
jgi:hypothetical protein